MKTQIQIYRDVERKLSEKNELIDSMRKEYLDSKMNAMEIWNEQKKVKIRSRLFKDFDEVEEYINKNRR